MEIGQDLVWSAELFELEVYSWILRVMHLHTGLVATKVEETFVRLLLVRLCLLCEKFKTLFLVEESGPVVLTVLSSIAKVFILGLYFGLREKLWARGWVSRESFQVILGGGIWTSRPNSSIKYCQGVHPCIVFWLERTFLGPVLGLKRTFSSRLSVKLNLFSVDLVFGRKVFNL